jgi:hypothetical protein
MMIIHGQSNPLCRFLMSSFAALFLSLEDQHAQEVASMEDALKDRESAHRVFSGNLT